MNTPENEDIFTVNPNSSEIAECSKAIETTNEEEYKSIETIIDHEDENESIEIVENECIFAENLNYSKITECRKVFETIYEEDFESSETINDQTKENDATDIVKPTPENVGIFTLNLDTSEFVERRKFFETIYEEDHDSIETILDHNDEDEESEIDPAVVENVFEFDEEKKVIDGKISDDDDVTDEFSFEDIEAVIDDLDDRQAFSLTKFLSLVFLAILNQYFI